MATWDVRVDAGSAWRPPFGLDRVGAPPVVHVTRSGEGDAEPDLEVVAYRGGVEVERHPLRLVPAAVMFAPTTPDLAGTVTLSGVPDEATVVSRGAELAREAVDWPDVEAAVVTRSDEWVNPVDLGTVLVPGDWLLLAGDRAAIVEVAALSRAADVPGARVRVGFDGGEAVDRDLPLRAGARAAVELRLPAPTSERSTLRIAVLDGAREMWSAVVPTMVVLERPAVPGFGAIWTKLRYDGTIPVRDEETGERTTIAYEDGWDPAMRDVVVYLPDGARFVFWRGANYIPFWASAHNTGFTYEWAETVHPEDGFPGSVEPLSDRELRYGSVRIVESTAARVHVQWRYQPTSDAPYKTWGEYVTEDFVFYPDGFATRALTLASEPGWRFELTEFIVFTSQSTYPLEKLQPRMDVLHLDGRRDRLEWPRDAHVGNIEFPDAGPMLFRVYQRDDDPRSWIYFSPKDVPKLLMVYAPREADGEEISPAFWGSHGPLSRDTSWSHELVGTSPAHNSLATWGLNGEGTYSLGNDPQPYWRGVTTIVDAHGTSREMEIRRWVWLIGDTAAPDEELLGWASSFATPPSLAIAGGRVDLPSYLPERRALRILVEAPELRIRLIPSGTTVNPVFELVDAPPGPVSVTVDGSAIAADDQAWDGGVLWLRLTVTDPTEIVVGFDRRATAT
jgi:hypothetical protein